MIYELIKVADRLEYNLYSYASEALFNDLKAKYADKEKYPELQQKLDKFKTKHKYIRWLADRFGESPTKQDHPITDCIDILSKYLDKEDGLAQKYRTRQQFRDLVKELTKTEQFPEGKTYTDIKVIENMTSDEMRAILLASQRKKEVVPTAGKVNISGDKVGEVGEWNIWLPSSRDNSIHIAQFDTDDAGNKVPKTTWCTARVDGSNLFYNYIGKHKGGKLMLFYVIKDNPQKSNDEDFLSIGFENGEPILPCGKYGESIDRDQNGLTVGRLQNIWGGNYQAIMDMMQKKCDELNGVSPAYSIIEDATKDLSKFKALIASNSKKETEEFVLNIMSHFKLDESIEEELIKSESYLIKQKFATSENSSEKILKLLAGSNDVGIRLRVACNPGASEEILMQLLKDRSFEVQSCAAENKSASEKIVLMFINSLRKGDVRNSSVKRRISKSPNATEKILMSLINDESADVREGVAENKNATESMLMQLAQDKADRVAINVATNKNTTEKIFMLLAKHENLEIRRVVAAKPTVGSAVLELLAEDESILVKREVAHNPGASEKCLMILSQDKNYDIKISIASNKNATEKVLKFILNNLTDSNSNTENSIKATVAENGNATEEILMFLAKEKDKSVKMKVAGNRKATKEILMLIFQDEDIYVKIEAALNIKMDKNIAANMLIEIMVNYSMGSSAYRDLAYRLKKEDKNLLNITVKEIIRLYHFNKGYDSYENLRILLQYSGLQYDNEILKLILNRIMNDGIDSHYWKNYISENIRDKESLMMFARDEENGTVQKNVFKAAEFLSVSQDVSEILGLLLKSSIKNSNHTFRRQIANFICIKNYQNLLREMVTDPDKEIRFYATRKIQDKDILMQSVSDDDLIMAILQNPFADKDVLEKILQKDENSRWLAAKYLKDKDLLNKLLKDPSSQVKDKAEKRLIELGGKTAVLFNRIYNFYKLASSNYYTSI